MLLTPALFILYDKVIAPRGIAKENESRPHDEIHEENPIILLGHGRFGRQINSMLTGCGFHTTVIDFHAETVEGLSKYGCKIYYGDARDLAVHTWAADVVVAGMTDCHRRIDVFTREKQAN